MPQHWTQPLWRCVRGSPAATDSVGVPVPAGEHSVRPHRLVRHRLAVPLAPPPPYPNQKKAAGAAGVVRACGRCCEPLGCPCTVVYLAGGASILVGGSLSTLRQGRVRTLLQRRPTVRRFVPDLATRATGEVTTCRCFRFPLMLRLTRNSLTPVAWFAPESGRAGWSACPTVRQSSQQILPTLTNPFYADLKLKMLQPSIIALVIRWAGPHL